MRNDQSNGILEHETKAAMSIDERYIIDTPENIDFSYRIAGIGSRFLAAIIDTILLLTVQILLLSLVFAMLQFIDTETSDNGMSIILAIWGVLSFAFFWGYYIFFELLWNGQSPGKRIIRLRVVREGGRPVTFAASAIRNLIRVIDFLPGFYGLGVLVMFIDRQARRLGDLTGGTLVVKERAAVSLDTLLTQTTQPPHPFYASRSSSVQTNNNDKDEPEPFTPSIPNLHLLTQEDYDLIQEFLRRRRELGTDSRQRLGNRLATGISNRLTITVAPANQEQFLEQVVHEYRQLAKIS